MADEDARRYEAGLPVAGRWDRDPVRGHPGRGMWMDPGPTARPEPGDPGQADDDPVARLRRANGGASQREPHWSADVTRPTVQRIDLTRGVR